MYRLCLAGLMYVLCVAGVVCRLCLAGMICRLCLFGECYVPLVLGGSCRLAVLFLYRSCVWYACSMFVLKCVCVCVCVHESFAQASSSGSCEASAQR